MKEVSEAPEETMDLGMDNNDDLGEEVPVSEDYFDNNAFGNEKCGICMDVVIDRGALDCCNHWFCFPCIDNWATITNLCPLCKNEFQLITCVPVYDTLGNFKVDEHSLLRDEDWCIEEKNNTLSFPSYYINEDAVKCLDGDACKVRNGAMEVEEDLILDTSIACDSCDMWYHAFCVGFDPESAIGTSWLCPRCIANRVPYQHDQRNADYGHSIDSGLTGKMSISVADDGETAVVVSMVDGKQPIEVTSDQPESIFKETVKKRGKSSDDFGFSNIYISQEHTSDDFSVPIAESSFCNNSTGIQNGSKLSADLSSRMGVMTAPDVILSNDSTIHLSDCVTKTMLLPSGSQDLSTFSLSDSLALDSLRPEDTIHKVLESHTSDGQKVSSVLTNNSSIESAVSGKRSVAGLHVVPAVGSSPSGGDADYEAAADDETVKGEKMATGASESIARAINDNGLNGRTLKSGLPMIDAVITDKTMKRERESECETETEICTKKPRSCVSQMFLLTCQESTSVANSSQGNCKQKATCKDDKLLNTRGKENMTSDIMSIVQGSSRSSSNNLAATSSSDKINGTNGIRVKKIMRVAESNESSVLVQKLRKEIQEAVRNNPSKDFGKDSAFDRKLLTAFRAAIAGPRNDPVNKVNPSLLRMKKSLLQSGKSRENLTKKIYGTANGRRRRAWDRDWEIEFWKHRCLSSKGEKVETLQSVLDLLKTISSSDKLDTKEDPGDDCKNSILSRVYLADTSVFPRNGDIQPLSALAGSSMTNNVFNKDKECKLGSHQENPQNSRTREESHHQQRAEQILEGRISVSSSSKQKKSAIHSGELTHQIPSVKTDKRKWALEVLARKNALTNGRPSQGKQENSTILKGSYPLLAQLPVDMKPVVAPSRHNKVPFSVRQAQLYRLTEFYLRVTNLSVISRTAVTELAVADAVNVEKEIFERSNSKLVYMNRCSQHVTNSKLRTAEKAKSHNPTDPAEETRSVSEVATVAAEGACDIVEEALKMTGLFPDSPTNSSDRSTKSPDDKDSFQVNGEDNHHVNVLDLDSNAELDIYGDFEYDLEDEGYIVSSSTSRALIPSLQSEDGDLKIKVVLSTPNSDKLDKTLECKDDPKKAAAGKEQMSTVVFDNSKVSEVPILASPPMPTCQMERVMDDLSLRTLTDCQGLVMHSPAKENYEEPSLAECKELYGPEKERLVEKLPLKQTRDTVGNIGENDRSKDDAPEVGFQGECCAENNLAEGRSTVNHKHFEGENSPTHSVMSENVPQKEIRAHPNSSELLHSRNSVSLKVEAYIKEHIRPLCKSRVITAEQYRWAVGKTRDKVMMYHCKAKNANFLVKEGDKVKKLAEQYVEAAQQKDWKRTERNKGNN